METVADIFEVDVTEEFFQPYMEIEVDRWRQKLFLRFWKRIMSQLPDDNYYGNWAPKILRIVECKPSEARDSSRVMASMSSWLGTNNGFSFAEKVLKAVEEAKKRDTTSYFSTKAALAVWAFENSLYNNRITGGGRTLQRILGHKHTNMITTVENDAAEKFITWLAQEEGQEYLRRSITTSETRMRKLQQRISPNKAHRT